MKNTKLIKQEAARIGFSYCGISKAGFLEEDAYRLEQWLNKDMHGKMSYMEKNFDKRVDPGKLLNNAKSVISVLYNYYTSEKQKDHEAPKISKYAYGKDYHFVVKNKLKSLLDFIQNNIGQVNGRAFVDTAPILERVWARKSGLGWIGKNTNLINKKNGSYFFLGELIIDLSLKYDVPIRDYCGRCRKCIDACPTNAIVKPYILDSSKCISYFTIELKDNIPIEVIGKFKNWVFGCDICQDVCPWNRFSKPNDEPAFTPNQKLLNMSKKEWEKMTEEVYNKLFKGTPILRTKYKDIKKNIDFLKKQNSK